MGEIGISSKRLLSPRLPGFSTKVSCKDDERMVFV